MSKKVSDGGDVVTVDIVKQVILKEIPAGQEYVERTKLPESFPYPPDTMRQYDFQGIGPKGGYKIGNKVFYKINPGLIDWLCSRITTL